jgi:hypothetical protein
MIKLFKAIKLTNENMISFISHILRATMDLIGSLP